MWNDNDSAIPVSCLFFLLLMFQFTGIAMIALYNIPSHLYIFIAGTGVAVLCSKS